MNKNKVLLFCVVLMTTIVILWNAIALTSCSNEDNSAIPVIPDDTPVVQEWNHDHEYVPFVEEGKVWNCCSVSPETDIYETIDCIFTMSGDTLIGEKNYKKVFCQHEKYYGDNEQHYYCAVREEAYRVFAVEAETNVEKPLYDFSQPQEMLLLSYDDHEFARMSGTRLMYWPSKQLIFMLYGTSGAEIDYYYGYGDWVEGVGLFSGNPFAGGLNSNKADSLFGYPIVLISCMKDEKCYFLIDWMAQATARQ